MRRCLPAVVAMTTAVLAILAALWEARVSSQDATLESRLEAGGDLRSIIGQQNITRTVTLPPDTYLELGRATYTLCAACQVLYSENVLVSGWNTRFQATGPLPVFAPAGPGPTPQVRLKGLEISGCACPGSVGILWQNVQWGVLEDLRVENAETLVRFDAGDASTLYNRAEGLRLRFGTVGIDMAEEGANNANLFLGGQISNVQKGVVVRQQSNKFVGFNVEVFGDVGIEVMPSASDTMISGGHFELGGKDAIRIHAGAMRTTTIGNACLLVNNCVANSAGSELLGLDLQYMGVPLPLLATATRDPLFQVGSVVYSVIGGKQGVVWNVYGRTPPAPQDYYVAWNDGSQGIWLETELR